MMLLCRVAPAGAVDAIGMLSNVAACGNCPPLGNLIDSPLLTGVSAPFSGGEWILDGRLGP